MKLHTVHHTRRLSLGYTIFAAIMLILSWYTLQVSRIDCTYDGATCLASMHDALSPLRGSSLIAVDIQERAQELLATHSVIVTSIQKHFPRSVTIHLESVPIRYTLISSEQSWDVNDSGMLFAATGQSEVRISTALAPSQLIHTPTTLQPALHTALRTLAQSTLPNQATQIELLDNETISVSMKDGARVLLPIQETAIHLAELQQILSSAEYREVSTRYQEIDVRFKLPVLRKKQ